MHNTTKGENEYVWYIHENRYIFYKELYRFLADPFLRLREIVICNGRHDRTTHILLTELPLTACDSPTISSTRIYARPYTS